VEIVINRRLSSRSGDCRDINRVIGRRRQGGGVRHGIRRSSLSVLKRCVPVLVFLLSGAVAASAKGTGYVFVSHEKMNSIAVIDPVKENHVVKWIATSRSPHEMKFRDNRQQVLVACRDDDVIDVIDVATLRVVDHIPTGPRPVTFELSQDEQSLLVPNPETSTVAEIYLEDRLIEREIPVGADPECVLASADGKTLYVASEANDLVHVVDLAAGVVTDNILVGTRPRRFLLLPARKELWVSNEASGEVSIIDYTTQQVTASLVFQPPGLRGGDVTPVGMTVTRNGATAIVALGLADTLAFVDTATRRVEDYVSVSSNPRAVALSPDEQTLYVANTQSDDISMVDMANHKVTRAVSVGRMPYSVLVDN
jgi:YVTN family beta-propeller protein